MGTVNHTGDPGYYIDDQGTLGQCLSTVSGDTGTWTTVTTSNDVFADYDALGISQPWAAGVEIALPESAAIARLQEELGLVKEKLLMLCQAVKPLTLRLYIEDQQQISLHPREKEALIKALQGITIK